MNNRTDLVQNNLSSAPIVDRSGTQPNKTSVLTGEEQVLPLYKEELALARRRVDREVVRIATTTHTREVAVNEQLTHERVEVERIPIGRVIEVVPPVREEGDITIIPVVEEIVVIERRLVLKEEVRLRRVRVTEQHQETVFVREQDAVVTRTKVDKASV